MRDGGRLLLLDLYANDFQARIRSLHQGEPIIVDRNTVDRKHPQLIPSGANDLGDGQAFWEAQLDAKSRSLGREAHNIWPPLGFCVRPPTL